MIILNSKIELSKLKEKGLMPNELTNLVERDITFTFNDFPHLENNNYLISYILIGPNENAKSIIWDDIDLLTQTKPLNISFYSDSNIIKATTKTILNYYISVYFYSYTSIELMNWIK